MTGITVHMLFKIILSAHLAPPLSSDYIDLGLISLTVFVARLHMVSSRARLLARFLSCLPRLTV